MSELSPAAKHLQEILELGREYRVKCIKTNGWEIEFGPHFTPLGPAELAKVGVVPIGADKGMPTDEELLFGSSEVGPPDIKAEPPA